MTLAPTLGGYNNAFVFLDIYVGFAEPHKPKYSWLGLSPQNLKNVTNPRTEWKMHSVLGQVPWSCGM